MFHTGQVAIQLPSWDIFYIFNIMWFLAATSRENGGTRISPGSRMGYVALDAPFNIDGTLAADGLTCSALLFKCRLRYAEAE
ncbi:uncharacterized protein A1O5_06781 [Cladophialophora psammophila CBS 110553]|uniref:Uncharacterized protein n=1 Tax=Cladophialophora psammophila CBS 110553 TaxID=1182543 RepID=W9WXB2_9EURO|nr:uncharacterized protein A1O5_06781 [Cladophialophora psammophila CBS 110553]EXJ69710.1 hypothetical protein A1O5_06781 [Cladophialophora psammophila CBS 110553]